jgi:hypothetical protein
MVFALMLPFAQMIHYVPRTLARREPVPSRTYQKAGEYSSQPFTCFRSISLTQLLRMDSVMIPTLARLMRAVPPRDASTHPARRILVTTAMTARQIRATSLADAIALPFQTVAEMVFAKKAKAPAVLQTAPRGLSRSEGSNAPLVLALKDTCLTW